MRLRSTARRAHFFETASPRRAGLWPLCRTRIAKQASADRVGCAKRVRKSPGRLKRTWRGRSAPSGFPGGRSLSGRQMRTSFGTTCRQHLTSAARGHAGPKAMGPRPLQPTGLKGSFHVTQSSIGGEPLIADDFFRVPREIPGTVFFQAFSRLEKDWHCIFLSAVRSTTGALPSIERENSVSGIFPYANRSVAIVRETRNGVRPMSGAQNEATAMAFGSRVRPASVPARTPRGTRTPVMTGRRVAWPGLASPPALTRRTPTKRSALRLRGVVARRSSLTLPRFPVLLRRKGTALLERRRASKIRESRPVFWTPCGACAPSLSCCLALRCSDPRRPVESNSSVAKLTALGGFGRRQAVPIGKIG